MQTMTIKELNQKLNQFQKELENPRDALLQIGNLAQNTIEESFDKQASPFGEKWKPNAPSTLLFKRGNKTLINSGALAQSFTQKVTGKSVTIGTNKEYAAIHNFGGKAGRGKKVNIPARPFIPITKSGEIPREFGEKIKRIVLDSIKKVLK